jgi:hypothetical protein
MEKFFHTYFAGGYVGTSEIAGVLLEATTGFDLYQAELATVLRNSSPSSPDELAEGIEALKTSDDLFDKFIVESLVRKPIDEDTLSYYRFQLAQWEDSIEKAAVAHSWTCLDLRSLAPVPPGPDFPYCVNVRDVITWLSSLGHSPSLGDILADMLEASRCRNGEEGGPGLRRSTRDSSKLAVIAALLAEFPPGKRPTGKDLEKAAQSIGVDVSDDTIRAVMAEAELLTK